MSEKNNSWFDHRLAFFFNETISALALMSSPYSIAYIPSPTCVKQPTLARLDRAFINSQMSSLHPNTTLTSLTRTTSDHIPLLVTITTDIPRAQSFRFENAWLLHPSFLPCITRV
jgi:hypothetical protein